MPTSFLVAALKWALDAVLSKADLEAEAKTALAYVLTQINAVVQAADKNLPDSPYKGLADDVAVAFDTGVKGLVQVLSA